MDIVTIPVTQLKQNCNLLICPETNEAVLVDPGGDIPLIKAAIESKQAKITKIILTHGHADHCAASRKLASEYEVALWGPHRNDIFWLELISLQSTYLNIPPEEMSPIIIPDKFLEESDIIFFGKQKLHTLFCPGHTPGHLVFCHHDSRSLFVGDVLFRGSIGRTDFPHSNHDDLIQSIYKKILPLGDDYKIYPGHGPISTIGREIRCNRFLLKKGDEK